MTLQEELLFDLIESEALVNIFLDRPEDNFRAKGAAITIAKGFGHMPKKRGDKYTVWFGRGIKHWSFKTFKESVTKVFSILKTAKSNLNRTYRVEGRRKTSFNRLFTKLETKK